MVKSPTTSKEMPMPVLMMRYEVAHEGVAEVVDAIGKAFAALKAERPKGIRYAYLHDPERSEFIALLKVAEGIENPLPGIEAARGLQATVAKWAAETAPAPQPLDVVGTYRVLG